MKLFLKLNYWHKLKSCGDQFAFRRDLSLLAVMARRQTSFASKNSQATRLNEKLHSWRPFSSHVNEEKTR